MTQYCEAREALSGAIKIRKLVGATLDQPLAAVDVALQMDVLVAFSNLTSAEGMWCKEKRAIVLTSLRPPGRRAFTCAHEIAHCYFNHGSNVDELLDGTTNESEDPDEVLANMTAGYLLMPMFAVSSAFQQRGWDPDSLSPEQAYSIACYFGVSYQGLLNQMCFRFKLIRWQTFDRLSKVPAKKIRSIICPDLTVSHLLVVDRYWKERPIDLDVGDAVILPEGARISGSILEEVTVRHSSGITAIARAPGIATVENLPAGISLTVRICPAGYCGFAKYRFPKLNNVYRVA